MNSLKITLLILIFSPQAAAYLQSTSKKTQCSKILPNFSISVNRNIYDKSILTPLRASKISSLFSVQKPLQLYPLVGLLISAILLWFRKIIWKPSRSYNKEKNTVGKEYDAWTSEGILEYYWGEHIHLGYYTENERIAGYKKKNFIQAKYDFIDKMLDFGKIESVAPKKVLDVGCGIGGTSRYLAKKFGSETSVTGITV
jgi:hypothetical protein